MEEREEERLERERISETGHMKESKERTDKGPCTDMDTDKVDTVKTEQGANEVSFSE